MARIELEPANCRKIAKWAREQGLEVPASVKFPELMTILRAAYPDISAIETEDDAPEPGAAAGDAAPGEKGADGLPHSELPAWHYRNDPRVTVNIASTDDSGGNHPVPLNCNGDHILVARNQDVAIPFRHYLALKNAVQTEYRQEQGPNRETVMVPENRYAFHFSVVSMPSQEEIAAWHERTRDIGRDKTEDPALRRDEAVEELAGKLLEKLTQKAA